MAKSKQPPSIYVSYAQKDEALKQEFEDYLVMLQQSQLISGWGERQVHLGTDWSQEIDPRLLVADLIVLLVSPGLLASGYCSGAEFSEAFERNKTGKAHLIPIVLHYVDLRGHPLDSIQRLPENAIPVLSSPKQKEAWWSVYQGIRTTIEAYY